MAWVAQDPFFSYANSLGSHLGNQATHSGPDFSLPLMNPLMGMPGCLSPGWFSGWFYIWSLLLRLLWFRLTWSDYGWQKWCFWETRECFPLGNWQSRVEERGVLEARETCVVLTMCTAVAPGEVSEHVLPFILPYRNGRMCKTVLENRLLVFFSSYMSQIRLVINNGCWA